MAQIFFASHELQIYRRRRIGSTNRFSMSATYTAFSGDIQPASQQRIQMTDGRFGKTFQAFIDPSIVIYESDQLRVTEPDGSIKRYSVTGVSKWSGAGLLDHQELIITSQD